LYGPVRNSSEREIPGDRQFSLPEIQKATKNFSPNLKIGQGGSGTVYKGQLSDGTLVAVKRAKKVCPYFFRSVCILGDCSKATLVPFHFRMCMTSIWVMSSGTKLRHCGALNT
jgi:hypothetical protein